ncbi:MAG TPA: hypothetical protein VH063_08720 [Gaiellaceae bacterium]|nr:hypothetical protein [Gaiellaceae bacterium]
MAVSADFLWHDRDWLAQSYGGRLCEADGSEIHVAYESDSQFAAEARRLAARAAEEVVSYRARFEGVEEWASELSATADDIFWQQFDAGIACALAGRPREAHHWLRLVRESGDDRDWVIAACDRARELDQLVDPGDAFVDAISESVARFRSSLRLAEIDVASGLRSR